MAEELIGLTPDGRKEVWRDTETGALAYKTPKEKRPAPQTAFDRRVEAVRAQGAGSGLDDRADVQILLKNAGVSETKIAEIVSNPSMTEMIKRDPRLVERLAETYPSGYAISYNEARQAAGLGLDPTIEQFEGSGGPDAMARNLAAAGVQSATGAIEYPGGVFVQDGQVYFPPTDASIMGSPAWMAQIPKWDDAKKQQWAKTLKQMGYIDSAKVDLVTFTDALTKYHSNRFIYGGGAPVDLSVGGAKVDKAAFGGLLDPAVLNSEVRTWHQAVYGANDEPSDEELKRGRRQLSRLAMRFANKGMDPSSAASVASARAQERFTNDPATQKWQDMEETDTSLHDSFVNLFQALSR